MPHGGPRPGAGRKPANHPEASLNPKAKTKRFSGIRVTEEEYRLLSEAAEAAGKTKFKWAREILLNAARNVKQ